MDEQLEFLISQHADGTLPASERVALEARLATDAEARALFEEYRALDASLKSSLPLPAVRWNRLAEHLSEAIADHRETRAATVLGRIGMWGRLAVAACVVLAVGGVALWTQMKPRDDDRIVVATSNPPPITSTEVVLPAPAAVVIVRGPAPEAPTSEAVVVVSIGPSSNVADGWRAAEGVVTGPARAVWIASGHDAAQDTQRLPY